MPKLLINLAKLTCIFLLIEINALAQSWISRDFGDPSIPGNATHSSGISIYAGGIPTHDNSVAAGHFYFQPHTGDFELNTQIAVLESYAGLDSQAGLMARTSAEADSSFVMLGVTPEKKLHLSFRADPLVPATTITNVIPTELVRLRLVKVGSIYSAYWSIDNQNWTLVGTCEVDTGVLTLAGPAVSCKKPGAACRAWFSESKSYPYIPQPGPDLRLWLRADKGVTLDAENKVIAWADQSGNGNSASQPTPDFRPLLKEAKDLSGVSYNSLEFDWTPSQKFMSVADHASLDPADISLFILSKKTNPSDSQSFIAKTGGVAEQGYTLGYAGTSLQSKIGAAGPTWVNTNATSNSQYGVVFGVASGQIQLYENTIKRGFTSRSTAVVDSTGPLVIGSVSASGTEYRGRISEILIYGKALLDAERKNVEAYLCSRSESPMDAPLTAPPSTNVTGTVASAQTVGLLTTEPGAVILYTLDGSWPGSFQSTFLYTGPFNIDKTTTIRAISFKSGHNCPELTETITVDSGSSPVPRDGLRLWLRGDVGLKKTEDGITWYDQSGLKNDAVENGAGLSLRDLGSNKKAVSFFYQGNYLKVTDRASLNPSQVSIFTVVEQNTSSTALAGIITKHGGTAAGYYLNTQATSHALRAQVNTVFVSQAATKLGTGFHLVGSIYDQQELTLYKDGAVVGVPTSATAAIGSLPNDLLIGSQTPSTGIFQGYIAEVLIYGRSVSAQEREAIEAYLYSKYDMQVQKLDPPLSNVPAATYDRPQTVVLSSAEPNAEIRYTLNGTLPNRFSTLYTAPLTVDKDQVLSAIAVKPGYADSDPITIRVDLLTSFISKNGLSLWLKADAGVTTLGNFVTHWADQSGVANHASVESNYPELVSNVINGRPAVKFTKALNQYLRVPTATSLSQLEASIFAVVRRSSTVTGERAGIVAKHLDNATGYYLNTQAASPFHLRGQVNSTISSQDINGIGTNFCLVGSVYNKQNLTLYKNGLSVGMMASTASIADNPRDLLIGCQTKSTATPPVTTGHFDGEIAEVFVYNRGITEEERKGLEAYVNNKYFKKLPAPVSNVTGTIASTQTVTLSCLEPDVQIYYTLSADGNSVPSSSSSLYNPAAKPVVSSSLVLRAIAVKAGYDNSPELREIITLDPESAIVPRNGLSLWLRADAAVSTTGVKDVAVWYDQSPAKNNAIITDPSAVGAPEWISGILNSKPIVRFKATNNQYLKVLDSSSLSPSQVSIFTVLKRGTSAPNAVAGIISKHKVTNPISGYYLNTQAASPFVLRAQINNNAYQFNPTWDGDFHVVGSVYDQKTITLYKDGQVLGTPAALVAAVTPHPGDLFIGSQNGTTSGRYDGDIAEVFVYGRAVSAEEREDLESYVYKKYQLNVQQLPGQPVSSLKTGTYPATQTARLSYVDATATIHFTTNDSPPTTSSSVYNPITGIVLNSNSVLRAIAVKSGYLSSAEMAPQIITFDTASADLPRDGLTVWLKADKGVTTSGATVNVTKWLDQSGNVFEATSGGNPELQANVQNGQPVVRFSGDYMQIPHDPRLSPQDISIFTVVKRAGSSAGGIISKHASSKGYSLNIPSAAVANLQSQINASGASVVAGWDSNFHLMASIYDQNSIELFKDGLSLASTVSPGTIADSASNLFIGSLSTGTAAGIRFNGDIAEVLIYGRAVTSAERRKIERYILTRYAVGNQPVLDAPVSNVKTGTYVGTQFVTLVSADPGAEIRYTVNGSVPTASSILYLPSSLIPVSSNIVLRAAAFRTGYTTSPELKETITIDSSSATLPRNGLALWLRSDRGVSVSGVNVIAWSDQSGLGNHAISVNSPALHPNVKNGQPIVRFSAANNHYLRVLSNPSLNPDRVSIFAVVKRSLAGVAGIVSKHAGGASGYSLGIPTSTTDLRSQIGGAMVTAAATWDSDFYLVGSVYDQQYITLYKNGLVLKKQSYTNPAGALSDHLLIGSQTETSGRFDGDIAEVIIYDRAVTGMERDAVESYLYDKYQLNAELLAKPSSNVKTGTYASGRAVVLTSAKEGAQIRYTLDGSVPTRSSTLYTTPIAVGETKILRAIAVKSGYRTSDELNEVITIDSGTSGIPRDGMTLWLRADRGVTISGTVDVIAWSDQSGSGNNAVASASNKPVRVTNSLNTKPAVSFSSANNSYMTVAGVSPYSAAYPVSVFTVVRRTSGSGNAVILEKFDSPNAEGYSLQSDGLLTRNFVVNNSSSSFAVEAPGTGYLLLEGISGASRRFYMNGMVKDNVSAGQLAAVANKPTYIGGRPLSSSLDGEIAEILVFERALTDQERRNIEHYIYSNYGIGAPMNPPAFNIGSGVYSTSRTLTMSADSGANIHYTSDGTAPTEDSPVYTSPLLVTQTTTYRAIAIKSGFATSIDAVVSLVFDSNKYLIPTDGLRLWLRADGGVLNEDGFVTHWEDLSGQHNHASQQKALMRPVAISAAVNGKPTVAFEKSRSTFMEIADSSSLDLESIHVFVVLARTGDNDSAVILTKRLNDDGAGFSLQHSYDNLRWTASGQEYSNTLRAYMPLGRLPLRMSDYHLVSGSFGNPFISLFIDRKQLAYQNANLPSYSGMGNTNSFAIGGRGALDGSLDGQIAAIWVYDRVLTAAERESLESYAATQFGTSPLDITQPSQALITDLQSLSIAEGGTGQFTVQLAARPAGNVEVAVSIVGDEDVTNTSSGPLIFTSSNWDSPQALTIAAAQDADGSDGVATVTLSTPGLSSVAISIKEIDDEPGVTVWESNGGTVVTEGFPADSYSVVLSSAPAASVTLTPSTASSAIQLSPAVLTFNSGNWNVPQTISVTAVNDAIAQGGARQAVISHTITSTDIIYDGMPITNVNVTVQDNDIQKIIVSQMALLLSENVSPGATLQVKLERQPTADVTVEARLSPTGDPDIKLLSAGLPVSSASLVFTPADWHIYKALPIAAANDADREDGTSILTLSSGTLVEPVLVSLAEVENDLAGVSLLQTGGTTQVAEGGISDTYALVLRSQPSSTVTITPSDETGRVKVSPAKLQFTSSNWSIPQFFSVVAVNDSHVNAVNEVMIKHTASAVEIKNSSALGHEPLASYNGMPVRSLTVKLIDNDWREEPAEAPTAPWSVDLSEVTSSSVKVAWTDISFNETQFVVEAYEVVDEQPVTNWLQVAVRPANTLSVTVLGLKEKTQYAFAVSARNVAGTSRGHEVKFATTLASVPPALPTPTVIALAPDHAVIGWQPPAGVKTGFRIEQQIVGEELSGWLAVEDVSADTAHYQIDDLDAAKSYRFRVITLNSGLESGASPFVTIPAIPGPVENLALSLTSLDSVKLVWSGPVAAVTTFELSRFSPSTDPSSSWITTLSSATFSFHETALVAATHKYRLRARNSRGEGPASESFIATTQERIPLAPGSFTATQAGARKIHLQWQDNAADELHYSLERKRYSDPASAYVTIATLPAQLLDSGSMTYEDIGLEALESYMYRLKCTNVYGSSSWVEASATTVDHVVENRRPDGTGLLPLHGLTPAVMEVRSIADVASLPDNAQFISDSVIVGSGKAYEGRKNAALVYDGISGNWTLLQDAVRKSLADDSMTHGLLITDLDVPENNDPVGQALDHFVALPSNIVTTAAVFQNQQTPPLENTVMYADGFVFYAIRDAARSTNPSVKCGCVAVFSVDFSSSPALTYVGALWPPSEADADGFGSSLSYDEGILVVGAPGKDTPSFSDVGCVYKYDLSGVSFPNLGGSPVIISPPEVRAQAGMAYGYSVAMAGSRLVIGAPKENVFTSGTTYLEAGAVYLTTVDAGAKHLRITNLLPYSYPGSSADGLADEWREGMQYSHFGHSVALDHAMRILVGAPHVSGEAWETQFETAPVSTRDAAATLAQGGIWLLHWDGQLNESKPQWGAILAAGYPMAISNGYSYENQLQVGSGCEFSSDEGIFAVTIRNSDYFAVSEFADSSYLYQTGHLPSAWKGTVYQVNPVTAPATSGFAGLLSGVDADGDPMTYEMASSVSSGIRFINAAPEPDEELADTEPGLDLQYLTVHSRMGTALPSIRLSESLPESLYAVAIKVSDDRGGQRNVPVKIHYGVENALLDTDGDGIPDAWESAHGLNPGDPSDAGLDVDHDGLSSWEEYLRSLSLLAFGVDPALWDLNPDGDEDDDSVPNKSDADPFDPSVGQLMTTLGITVRDAPVNP